MNLKNQPDMERIIIVDPSSRTLPYDYYYIREIAKSFRVTFFCSSTRYNNEYIQSIRALENVEVQKFRISDINRIVGLVIYSKMLFQIIATQSKYSAIHFFWSIAFALEAPFFLLIKRKLVFTFHNDRPHKSSSLTYWPFKFIYKVSQRAIFVSEVVQNRFEKNYRLNDVGKIMLVQHGIMPISLDCSLSDNSLAKPGFLEKRIVFWGTVKPYKGIDLFLKLKRDKYFDDFKFEIYGKWDKKLHPIKKRLEALGVSIVDEYLSISQLSKVLEINGIFILPYKEASQSGVLYTLLHYKKIFISTNTGDNAAFLADSDLSGLIFSREKIDELISAVDYCLKNHVRIMAKLQARSKEFDWSYVLQSTKKIYAFN